MRYCGFMVVCFLIIGCSSTSREAYDIPQSGPLSEARQLASILAQLSENIKSNPSNPLHYYKRAGWQFQAGNFEEALVDITRAERLNPNSGEILFLKSAILAAMNSDNALENALFAEDQAYSSPELFTLIGNLYLGKKQFAKAEEYFQKAEQIYPYESGIYSGRGRAFAMQSDTTQAIQYYKRALALRPGVFEHYEQLVALYGQSRQIDSALHYNELAIGRFPQRKELLYHKAFILEETGKLDSALVLYRQYLREVPDQKEVYERIGDLSFRRRDFTAAYRAYNKWAELEPESPVARLKAARTYIAQYNLAAAKNYLEQALEKHPNNALLKAELNAVNYRIASGAISSLSTEMGPESKTEEKRTFDRSLEINKIQNRRTTLIGRDSTRN